MISRHDFFCVDFTLDLLGLDMLTVRLDKQIFPLL